MKHLTNPLAKGLITDWTWSEAPSLTYPLRKGSTTDWSWCEALSFTSPLKKDQLQAGAGLNHFPNTSSTKGLIRDWSWSPAPALTNPFRICLIETSTQPGAVFLPLPLRI